MPTPPACALDQDKLCEATERLEHLVSRVEAITKAFPEDEFKQPDILGHRRYHEAKIAAAVEEKAFWRGLRQEITQKGIIGILLLVGGLAFVGALYWLSHWLGITPSKPPLLTK